MTERPSGPRRRHQALTAACALNLILLAGCDNVSWGGAQFAVIPPPPKGEEADVEAAEAMTGEMPAGAVLSYVRMTTGGPVLLPVGEVVGDTLRRLGDPVEPDRYWTRFVGEEMRQGAEYVLFSRGRRVGTFIIQNATVPEPGVCPALPQATGFTELTSGAGGAAEYLALPKRFAPDLPAAVDSALLRAGRRMSIVGPILAERMLRARSAGLPGNWQAAMKQALAFPAEEGRDLAFAATFLVGDTLGTGLDDDGYSLFFIAMPDPGATGYDTAYVNFRDYPSTGKAAPRVIDFLDWDRDGESELLLQVYGTQGSWFEAVGKVGDDWRTILELRCEGREAAIAAESAAAADSATADTVAGSPAPRREDEGPSILGRPLQQQPPPDTARVR
ncbi:MAG TPA: hypothetical protein VMK65_01470 [Longimicrobiales bacterium]|nr:hypothetical protein [Longimicrobiales bacterium]